MLPSTVAGTAITLVVTSLAKKYSVREAASVRVWVAPIMTRPWSPSSFEILAACSYCSWVLRKSWDLPR